MFCNTISNKVYARHFPLKKGASKDMASSGIASVAATIAYKKIAKDINISKIIVRNNNKNIIKLDINNWLIVEESTLEYNKKSFK